ncbi:MAG: hypothetical protein JXR76_32585, partial [Deltaproteobacteria bacterium]|nr:hypothetical protein [Deltaproteobacteria bacterium]
SAAATSFRPGINPGPYIILLQRRLCDCPMGVPEWVGVFWCGFAAIYITSKSDSLFLFHRV